VRKSKKITILPQVLIEDYASEGKSLARIDGKVIFVEGAVPGDVADLRITKSKKDWSEATVQRFHVLSPQRVSPFCTHFGTCGGCKWQMLPYAEQLKYKQREVEQQLKRIGKLEIPDLLPIIGSDATTHYRNKLEFTFSNKRYLTKEELEIRLKEKADQSGEEQIVPSDPALGFHVPRLFDKVIDIETCHLQPEPSNGIRLFIRQFSLDHGFSFYDIRAHQGWLRTLIIRTSSLGEAMVNVTFGHDNESDRCLLFDALLKAFPQITTLVYTINPKWNDSIHDLDPVTYYGEGYMKEKLGDFIYKIGPKSFFQTNTAQAEKLYEVTRSFAGLTGNEVLYDLYCGTGSIGIFCSKSAKNVIGVEVVAEAIEDAYENAGMNQLNNVSFFAGDVIDVCTDAFFTEHGRPDVVITDPPRAGMHEKLVRKLLEMEAPRIVYVSCNPATQARDLQLLNQKYSIEKLQPVDLFPHTHHIENGSFLKHRS